MSPTILCHQRTTTISTHTGARRRTCRLRCKNSAISTNHQILHSQLPQIGLRANPTTRRCEELTKIYIWRTEKIRVACQRFQLRSGQNAHFPPKHCAKLCGPSTWKASRRLAIAQHDTLSMTRGSRVTMKKRNHMSISRRLSHVSAPPLSHVR